MSWFWFHILLFGLLALDLCIFRKQVHRSKKYHALALTLFWVALALIFNLVIYAKMGEPAATQFFTAYLVEKSLSIDNLFVFLLIFSAFKVGRADQHRVLFWGILGALVLRILFIFGGIQLIANFHWMIYLLGAFLVFTAGRLILRKKREYKPEHKKWYLKLFRVTQAQTEGKFFLKQRGKWYVTPLFLVLLLIEITDITFAVDSIPAVFAITTDPFLAYTSNVFAILGLRALYFLLEGALQKLAYLKVGLSLILLFVGLKMLLTPFYQISQLHTLIVIALLLVGTLVFSLLRRKQTRGV